MDVEREDGGMIKEELLRGRGGVPDYISVEWEKKVSDPGTGPSVVDAGKRKKEPAKRPKHPDRFIGIGGRRPTPWRRQLWTVPH